MKSVIINEILDTIENGIKNSKLDPTYNDFISNSISRITYGNMSFNCNLELKISGDYGNITIYNKENKYKTLLTLNAKSHIIWFWTKKDSVEFLENRLYEIIYNAKEVQKEKLEKIREDELFDLLPAERKQQIQREKKLERLTK